MSNSNSTTKPVLASTIIRRRSLSADDITVRGTISDLKVSLGTGVKNAANLGLASVELVNEAIPMLKEFGYNAIDALQVVNRAFRMTNVELNVMVNEWMESSEVNSDDFNNMNLTAAEIAAKVWQQRKAAEAEKKAKEEEAKEYEALVQMTKLLKESLNSSSSEKKEEEAEKPASE